MLQNQNIGFFKTPIHWKHCKMVSLLLRRMFPAESFNAASVTSRQQTAQPNRHKNENSTLTRTNPLIGARHFQFMVQTEFWLKLTHLCDPRLLWKSLRPRMELTKGTLRPCPSPPSPCPGPYSLGRYQEDELRQISLYVKLAWFFLFATRHIFQIINPIYAIMYILLALVDTDDLIEHKFSR